MQFSCLKSNLDPILQTLARIVSPRPTLPVLSNVLIKATDKQVWVAGTNLDVGINANVGAKVEQEGKFTVPAKLLAEFVSSVPEDKIDFTLTNNIMTVKSGNYEASFNGIDADEFPENPALKGAEKVVINASDLVSNIPLVSFSAASDESRPVITGVMMLLDGKKMTLVAADGYRLAEKKIELHEDSTKSGSRLIIPARNLNELQRILAGAGKDDVVEVAYDDNQVIFSYKEVQLFSRLLIGQYPDYKQIIPAKFKTEATIKRDELQKAVRIAALFAKDSASVVHFELDQAKQTLTIKAASSQVGENSTVMSAKITGEDNKIAYNSRYVTDFLAVAGEAEITMRLNDALAPGILIPQGNDKVSSQYTYVIMPIRA